tara:strand:+ start:7244 stop:7834 length:591 start_codon:yes stop_codon:yes gene_type:complete
MRILVATENIGKFLEISQYLKQEGLNFTSQKDLGFKSQPEIGQSFVENAIAKARFACRSTGLISLAEDSGLVVPALNGDPGIYSARFAGAKATDGENLEKLLQRMENLKNLERRAFFVCAMTLVRHEFDPLPIIAIGKWEGRITHRPMGENGFGYDPIFFDEFTSKTAGQMLREEKLVLSHRGKALKLMLENLKSL